jgi:hypothetical protein
MMVITSNVSGTRVELWCTVCRQRLTLGQAWLAFPTNGDQAEGKWIHRDCLNGQVEAVFGVPTITMMRGDAALSHLAVSLYQKNV